MKQLANPADRTQVRAFDRAQVSEPPLVGRYFHIWGDDGCISRQGRVVAQIDPAHYLVQLYDWIVGEANTMHVYTLDDMTVGKADRAPGAWQFYESHEHWRFWMEHRAPQRPRLAAAE
jgi:hypothetical protein